MFVIGLGFVCLGFLGNLGHPFLEHFQNKKKTPRRQKPAASELLDFWP